MFAVLLNSVGMTTGLCTQGSIDAMLVYLVFSAPFYVIGTAGAWMSRPVRSARYVSIVLWPAACYVAFWAFGLFINTNIHNLSACTWKMGEYYGPVHGPDEYWLAPMYALGDVVLIAAAVLIFVRSRKTAVRTPSA